MIPLFLFQSHYPHFNPTLSSIYLPSHYHSSKFLYILFLVGMGMGQKFLPGGYPGHSLGSGRPKVQGTEPHKAKS